MDRKDRSLSVDAMSAQLRERLRNVAGITVTHAGLRDSVGGQKQVEFSIQGDDLVELERLSQEVLARIRPIVGLVDLDASIKANKPTVDVVLKRELASDAGLSAASVASGLRTLVAGQTVGNWRAQDGESYDVNVRLAPDQRARTQDLMRLPFVVGTSPDGSARVVRLAQVADVIEGTGPNQINRRNLNREVAINANVYGRSAGEVSTEIRKVLDRRAFSAGLPLRIWRLHQKHAGIVQLCDLGTGAGHHLHLHDPGQPVPELPATAGLDERPAADADRRGAHADDVRLHHEHVLGDRHRAAHGSGDQERHLAGRFRDSGPQRPRWRSPAAPGSGACCWRPRCGCARFS